MKTIDDVEEYWNNRPCNIRHSPTPIEEDTLKYSEEVTARKYMVEPHIPKFAEFAKWKNKNVLEIGCGIGTDTIQFAKAGAYVAAVDLSEESLKIAKARAEAEGVANRIAFINENAEYLLNTVPLRKRYDLIYSFGVIHHTPNPIEALDQIHLYASPDTVVKIMVYNRRSWKVLWILLKYGKGRFWKINDLIADYSEAETGCPVTYAYTVREARYLMEITGFDVVDVYKEHIFPYKIEDYIQYKYNKVWYFKILPKCVFRFMERTWGWHMCITAKRRENFDV
jgi:2-polyprenyl-3-methyl-5-hydroxy-6-metoxy-1,4-benzoquinol methylase